MDALSHPRWEDYDYTYVNSNSFGWFGNGWTQNELDKNINVDYLDVENIDFPIAQTGNNEKNDAVESDERRGVVNGGYTARL